MKLSSLRYAGTCTYFILGAHAPFLSAFSQCYGSGSVTFWASPRSGSVIISFGSDSTFHLALISNLFNYLHIKFFRYERIDRNFVYFLLANNSY
jgi:hypothetical protein